MAKQRTEIHGDDAAYVVYLGVIWLVLSILISNLAFHS